MITDDSCEVTIKKNPANGKIYLDRPCNNNVPECLQINTGNKSKVDVMTVYIVSLNLSNCRTIYL